MHRMIRPIEEFLDRSSKRAILAIAIALICAIAGIDWVTDADISLIMFQWVPVCLAVWYVGLRPGVALALVCVILATASDVVQGRAFHHPNVGLVSEFVGRAISFVTLCIIMDLLRSRTATLKTTAARLKAFDYSVAHDLRSPVRVITSFAEIIPLRGTGLDETSRGFLKRIIAASLRLSAMLEGLLLLSNLTERRIVRETVDLGDLSRRIFEDLQAQPEARPHQLRAPRSLLVFGDRQLLTVLMHNLLQNAWKFTASNEGAVIEVGVENRKGRPVFYVRDNGIGFDPAYADQLFQAFRRLPNAEGTPGQGIGLATAARAVEAHGGRIWAAGGLGQGATFFFTLGIPS